MDFAFMGGSMGSVVGEKFSRACDSAAERGVPLVSVTASGRRAHAGGDPVADAAAEDRLRRRGPARRRAAADQRDGAPDDGAACSRASPASATCSLAEPGALISFTGPRVVQQTTREKLPDDFGLAESNLRYGHVDAIVPRPELRADARPAAEALRNGRVSRAPAARAAEPAAEPAAARRREALRRARPARSGSSTGSARSRRDEEIWRSVELARHPDRPYTLDYVERLLDDWFELHGDRAPATTRAIVAGLGQLPTAARSRSIGHQKGRDIKERDEAQLRDGLPRGLPARRCARWSSPTGTASRCLTLVDTPGAYPGVAAEQHGQGGAIAALAGG